MTQCVILPRLIGQIATTPASPNPFYGADRMDQRSQWISI